MDKPRQILYAHVANLTEWSCFNTKLGRKASTSVGSHQMIPCWFQRVVQAVAAHEQWPKLSPVAKLPTDDGSLVLSSSTTISMHRRLPLIKRGTYAPWMNRILFNLLVVTLTKDTFEYNVCGYQVDPSCLWHWRDEPRPLEAK